MEKEGTLEWYKSKLANIKETLNEMQFSIPHHYKLPFNIASLT